MPIWEQCVDILRESMFVYAQACGGNLGMGILIVTFLVKLALMPLGIRVAKAAEAQQRAMRRLQPQLDAIRAKFKDNPQRVAEETHRLLTREGVSLIPTGVFGGIIQLLPIVALYSAVRRVAAAGGRFLWIRNIANPDVVLTLLVTGFTVAASAASAGMSGSNQRIMMLVSTALTLALLSKMAAGIGLYWGLSSLFSAAQGLVVRRTLRSEAV